MSRSEVEIVDGEGGRVLVAEVRADGAAALLDELRRVGAGARFERQGVVVAFRVEDLIALDGRGGDAEQIRTQLRRVIPAACAIEWQDGDGPLVARARFRERDGTRRRDPYVRVEGRLHVEAFELHVVEHCNLRCAHCCNMSPYLDAKFLAVDEVAAQCARMARHLRVDVFKIMGGEPLLHPQITAVLRAIRESGISDVVRLFTNGLLLHQMDDDFWRALDQLTISNYVSAPVRPHLLAAYRVKARAFDVVLNVKPVDQFSEVMGRGRQPDDAAVQATYDACWLRDRCLVVRDGAFFKCTRAAYFREFQARIELPEHEADPAAVLRGDGIPLDAADLGERLFAYMNSPTPLGACRWCQGSSGALVPHTQLTRAMIRRGAL